MLTVAVSSLTALMRRTFVPSAPATRRSFGVVPSALTNVTSARLALRTKMGLLASTLVLRLGDADHPLGVDIRLELGSLAELAEEELADRIIEGRAGQVGDDESQVPAIQLVFQVEHESGVARQARQVIDGDPSDARVGQPPDERTVAIAIVGAPAAVATGVADDLGRGAGGEGSAGGPLLSLR